MSIIAERLSQIKPSATLAMNSKAIELRRKGINVISLSVGEPDFFTPDFVKEAAIEAINQNKTFYTEVDGISELKKAIAEKFRRDNHIEYQTSQITVGTGAKQVIFNSLMATVNPGDEVIIPSPYWVSYPDMVALFEGIPVFVDSTAENEFKIKANDLQKAITPKTKWLILNSPSNPTGSVYTENELREIADVLIEFPHIYILSDDIYEHLIYDEKKFYTIAEVEPKLFDRILTVNGVSKSHSMTGWRIGYAGGNEQIIKAIAKVQSQSTSNPCSISQYAALLAVSSSMEFLEDKKIEFKKRRNYVIDRLNNSSLLKCNTPSGAFYLFPDCSKTFGKKTNSGNIINNSLDFCEYLLETALVATVPGIAFGMEGFFRISYATSMDILEEACNRIEKACLELK